MYSKARDWHPSSCVSEQAPGVFLGERPASNWIVARDSTGFMLIDSGYPADCALVLESIRHLGLEPAEARAVLITHGHVDHTGSAAHFSTTYGTPVLCAPEELAHVQGKEKHQVSFSQVMVRAWRPRVFRWMLRVIKAGAPRATPATRAHPDPAAALDATHRLDGVPASVVLPGHGPALRMPLADALAALRP